MEKDFSQQLDLMRSDPEPSSFDGGALSETDHAFRPIHYLGSKFRIASAISESLQALCPTGSHVLDLFSGSGSVAASLSRTFEVTAVDIQEYSRVVCSALLTTDRRGLEQLQLDAFSDVNEFSVQLQDALQPFQAYEQQVRVRAASGQPQPLCDFLEAAPIARCRREGVPGDPQLRAAAAETDTRLVEVRRRWGPESTAVSELYGGLYFSSAQAQQLDVLSLFCSRWPSEGQRDLLRAALLSAASAMVNTVGKQFAQPIRPRDKRGNPKSSLLKLILRDRDMDPQTAFLSALEKYLKYSPGPGTHRTYRESYRTILRNPDLEFDAVYADPPYTREHYSRFYHVLETIARRDLPEISKVRRNGEERLSRGVYREGRHQSEFCIRSKAVAAFTDLFSLASSRAVPLVLSYSPHENDDATHPRVVTLSKLTNLAEKHFRNVQVKFLADFNHAKLNHRALHKEIREHSEALIICSESIRE